MPNNVSTLQLCLQIYRTTCFFQHIFFSVWQCDYEVNNNQSWKLGKRNQFSQIIQPWTLSQDTSNQTNRNKMVLHCLSCVRSRVANAILSGQADLGITLAYSFRPGHLSLSVDPAVNWEMSFSQTSDCNDTGGYSGAGFSAFSIPTRLALPN